MYSLEHKSYLKKIKLRNFFIKLTQILILIVFLIVWQLLSDHKIINSFIFSSPIKVFNTIINLHTTGDLYNHILITVWETFISFILGTLIGILIASIMWWNK